MAPRTRSFQPQNNKTLIKWVQCLIILYYVLEITYYAFYLYLFHDRIFATQDVNSTIDAVTTIVT
jgi:hypothetical protein